MNLIELDPIQLGLAAALVVVVALLGLPLRLGLTAQLVIAGVRTVLQLLLVGLVLEFLFRSENAAWIGLVATIMLGVAVREVTARQSRPFLGHWRFALGGIAMFLSSFTVALIALAAIVRPEPWYDVRYAIPLLGMLLGNTMNGVAIGLDRLTTDAHAQRETIEARLCLGETASEAIGDVRRAAIRSGLIPAINAMAAAGVVSLPGMMTGQILAGTPPVEAVKYQILIMFLITAGVGFGTFSAVWLGARRLFDRRERLRLDRLS